MSNKSMNKPNKICGECMWWDYIGFERYHWDGWEADENCQIRYHGRCLNEKATYYDKVTEGDRQGGYYGICDERFFSQCIFRFDHFKKIIMNEEKERVEHIRDRESKRMEELDKGVKTSRMIFIIGMSLSLYFLIAFLVIGILSSG